jgi:hypothetical protein
MLATIVASMRGGRFSFEKRGVTLEAKVQQLVDHFGFQSDRGNSAVQWRLINGGRHVRSSEELESEHPNITESC